VEGEGEVEVLHHHTSIQSTILTLY